MRGEIFEGGWVGDLENYKVGTLLGELSAGTRQQPQRTAN